MRVVFDSTTLMSCAIATRDPLLGLIRAAFSDAFELVTSPYILAEVERGLHKPYFADRIARRPAEERDAWNQSAEAFLAAVRTQATVIDPQVELDGVVADPNDDPILAAAYEAQVDYLVSGDHALLSIKSFHGIQTMTARAFYELLQTQ